MNGRTSFFTVPDDLTIFHLLVLYRWLALMLVMGLFLADVTPVKSPFVFWSVLSLASFYNLFITIFSKEILNLILKKPKIIGIDIFFCFIFLTSTNGWASPYFLYTLSPIFLTIFFRRLRWSFLVAAIWSILYAISIYLNGYTLEKLWLMKELDSYFTHFFDFFMVAFFFTYPYLLISQLRETNVLLSSKEKELHKANTALGRKNLELMALQEINTAIQSTVNLKNVIELILETITKIGFDCALIGFFDEERGVLSSWQTSKNISPSLYRNFEIPVEKRNPFGQAFFERKVLQVRKSKTNPRQRKIALKHRGSDNFIIAPLLTKEKVLGALIVDYSLSRRKFTSEDLDFLKIFSTQVSIAIHNAQLYQKVKEFAISQERNRMAMEIHDGVLQNLYGAQLLVEACVKGFKQNQSLEEKLFLLRRTLTESLKDLRFCVDSWHEESPLTGFSSSFRRYVEQFTQSTSLKVEFNLEGKEKEIDSEKARTLFRILQEAMTNVLKHAQASSIKVKLKFTPKNVYLEVLDDGKGFNVEEVAGKNGSFGLINMKKRIKEVEGEIKIESEEGKGTLVHVKAPI